MEATSSRSILDATFDPEEDHSKSEDFTPAGEENLSPITPADYLRYGYIVIGIFGMVGNSVVILVILTSPALKKKLTNIYIISQSILDLGVSVFLIGGGTIDSDADPYGGTAGDIYCKFWVSKVTLWGFLIASSYNLVVLTIERYLEVVHPIWHKMSFGKKEAYASIVFAWLWGHLYGMAEILPSSGSVKGMCVSYVLWPNVGVMKFMGILTAMIIYFIPIGILIFCYTRIVLVMNSKIHPQPAVNLQVPKDQGQLPGQANPQPQTAKGATWHRAKRNTIKTLLLVAACYILCWSCNQVLFFLFNLGMSVDFSGTFYHFTVIAAFFNCCVNPFIYAMKYEQFQVAAKRRFCFWRPQQTANPNNSVVTGITPA